MESSWQDYRRDMDDPVIQSLHPTILETRIQTCRINYRDTKGKGKFPNAVILSNEARVVLINAGLLNAPDSVQDIKGRDSLNGRDFQLDVYIIYELTEEKNQR